MQKSILLLFACLLSVSLLAQEDGDIVRVGDTMPSFSIFSDNGKELKSGTMKGKVILVAFFATWCPPCQKELAAFEETLWPAYKNKKDFSLLVIGREHSDAELATYNEKKGFTFPLYADKNRAIYSKFATSYIPRIYLVGKDGKVLFAKKGYTDEDFAILMQKLENALK